MSGRGIPLTAINGGMNRLRVKGAARKDTLYQLTNAYVTAGNTIKPRGGTIRNANLATLAPAGSTKGLVAHQGALHVFSAQKVAVPAGYVDHVLSHPAVQASYTPPFPGLGLPGWANTVPTLLHFEEGNGSTAVVDSGVSPATWTATGAVESTVQAKFGTGSLLFNPGSASVRQYISAPIGAASSPLDLFTGNPDWTIEFFVYPSAAMIAGGQSFYVFAYDCDTAQAGKGFIFRINGNTLAVDQAVSNTWMSAGLSGASGFTANAWNHVAFVREGGSGTGGVALRLYANGVQCAIQAPNALANGPSAGGKVFVGESSLGFGPATPCYIDDVRITNGSCLYGGTFSPPAATLTTAPDVPYIIGSLVHFDDGANSTAFTDAVPPTAWTAAGAAKEVTAPVKFGAGAGQFQVNADFISNSVTALGPLDLSDTYCDFTVEGFIYPTDTTSGATHMWADLSHRTAGGASSTLFTLTSVNTNLTLLDYGSGHAADITAAGALPNPNAWYHVAVVRYGFTYLLFVNGVQVGTSVLGAGVMPSVSTGAHWYLGANGFAGTQTAAGFIDEFRAIKGLAVYKAAFTPPVAPYTAPGYTPIALLDIHFAAPFMGFLYVVAEFVSDGGSGLGTVFHYWLQTSGKWLANTIYQVGQIISPNVDNGLTYRAERFGAPNPAWAASTLKAVNDKVEPTAPNGFLYTATAVDGGNPITGTTEPTWPIVDAGIVFEESEKTNTGEVAAPAPQPTLTTPSPGTGGRYVNPYRTTVIG